MPRQAPVISVTRDEIESFWRRKRMEEEDHLLAALKAAARIRARNLKEEDYKLFEASLEGILTSGCDSKNCAANQEAPKKGKELGAVIRDWWTKSKYAYLNQPAVQSMEAEAARHRATTFTPSSYFWATGAVPAPRPPPALGVF
ncbi:unnamed protein product [Spirodela intermedia]|uniref:Uncharacterized protein n=2 Tax=Spirodela intermedia TaxID=51605 RepID=A0A7I8IE21_SPIIN|nr:unnamed protein product [Spirodela intermedia]CAA6656026.1 unnamed protein product [Spirodela intermedia]CAA7391458.1 unnamed protein product [Spirodela intermedia]